MVQAVLNQWNRKMDERTQFASGKPLTPVQGEILEVARKLKLAEGKFPSRSELALAAPGHSNRDLNAALDALRDEGRQMSEALASMPPSLKDQAMQLLASSWDMLRSKAEADQARLEKDARSAVSDARAARDAAEEGLEKLKAELSKSEDERRRLEADLADQEGENARLKDEAVKASIETAKLRQMVEDLRGEIDTLSRFKAGIVKLKEEADGQ